MKMKKFLTIIIGLSLVLVATVLTANFAMAQEAAAGAAVWQTVAGKLALGLAAFAGALGQGKVVAAVVESIGRNPGASGAMFVPMILGLAFIESLVLFAFIKV